VPELRVVSFGGAIPSSVLPLPERTEFYYQAPDTLLKEIYSRCDAWLFASRREGFGLPILEAMACRTPVIAAPAGASEELLRCGGGLLVPPENPQAMADAIVSVCCMSEAAWRGLSDAAHATATRYTWEEATESFEAALREAISSRDSEARTDVGGRS
jgi:glycosyltransferase involved in cell wall biosynthesis